MRTRHFLIALALALLPTLAQATITTATGTAKSTTATGGTGGVVWTYTVNPDGTATINQGNVGSASGAIISGDITLPDAVDGHGVTGIAYYTRDDKGTTTTSNDDDSNWKPITGITFPATLASIGGYVFCNAASLAAVNFNNPMGWASLRSIGYNAFDMLNRDFLLQVDGLDLSGLTGPTLEGGIFRNRGGVTGALTLPSTITAMDGCPFGGASLTSVNFTELTELTNISVWAFNICSLESVDLSQCSKLTDIAHDAFYGNTTLTSLELPASPSLSIGERAFMNDDLRGDLVIPSTGTTLGYNAFSNNSSLRSITFTGTSLDMGGYGVFSGCNGLEYIDMKSCVSITGVNSADATTLSRATSTAAGHMFAGLPTHTFVYLPNDGTVFNSTPGGGGLWDPSVEHWDIPNYATNGAAFLLLIEDGVDYFFPHPFKTDAVGYRDNSGNSTDYNLPTLTFQPGTTYSLYLPYDFTLPTGLGGYSPAYYNQHNPGSTTDNTFVFNKVSTFTANTPYLVRVEAGGAASTLPNIGSPKYETGVTIQKIIPASPVGVNHNELATTVPGVNTISFNQTDINGTTAVNRPSVKDKNDVVWSLCGTSETVDAATAASWGAWYFATDNTWYPVKGDAYSYGLRQHRAFMIPSVPGATPSKGLLGGLLNGGETTGIGNVTNDNATSTHIYHMSGQYLGEDINSLPRGVYVVNGKKVVK